MALVTVVSGYIDIPDHPRGSADYQALGAKLEDAVGSVPMVVGGGTVEDTWLAKTIRASRQNISHSVADNPAKNTLAYHCVQHEKFSWLKGAFDQDVDNTQMFVWIDYGILHVSGVTPEIIKDYLVKAQDFARITIPGCWRKPFAISPQTPCWRFCGGLLAVPRVLVTPFARMAMAVAMRTMEATSNIDWEVNTLARVEEHNVLPIVWYAADHNETMFTNAP
jgi:hypothetical protein